MSEFPEMVCVGGPYDGKNYRPQYSRFQVSFMTNQHLTDPMLYDRIPITDVTYQVQKFVGGQFLACVQGMSESDVLHALIKHYAPDKYISEDRVKQLQSRVKELELQLEEAKSVNFDKARKYIDEQLTAYLK